MNSFKRIISGIVFSIIFVGLAWGHDGGHRYTQKAIPKIRTNIAPAGNARQERAQARWRRLIEFTITIGNEFEELIPVEEFGNYTERGEVLCNVVLDFVVGCLKLSNNIRKSEFINTPQIQTLLESVNQKFHEYKVYLFANHYNCEAKAFKENFYNDIARRAALMGSSNAMEMLCRFFFDTQYNPDKRTIFVFSLFDISIENNAERCITFVINKLREIGINFEEFVNQNINRPEQANRTRLDELLVQEADPRKIRIIKILMQNGARARLILNPDHPNFTNFEPLRDLYNQLLAELGLE